MTAIPGAEFRLLPGVGHVPMADNPALVTHTTLEFVRRTVTEPQNLLAI